MINNNPIRSYINKRTQQSGASLVEFVVVLPTLLFSILGIMQSGMVFHAKSNLNYATFEAARTGSVSHGDLNSIRQAFTRAMVGYYGGGRTAAELAQSTIRATTDITPASFKVELLSPTKESFDDFASPKLSAKYHTAARVIPNNNLSAITCPGDKPSCNPNPNTNASGQTLSDANLLRIKITYGIPAAKQMPLVGTFYVKVLQGLANVGLIAETDPFKLALLQQGRIPMVTHTTMRMQSDAFENGNVSNPGAGNNGVPTVEEPVVPTPGGPGDGTGEDGGGDGNGDGGTGETPCNPAVDVTCTPIPTNPCNGDKVPEELSADVLFDTNESELKDDGKKLLDKIINTINAEKANSTRTDEIEIFGHADKVGTVANNLRLSQARADAVKDYIEAGLDEDVNVDISAVGMGEAEPNTSPGICTEEENSVSNTINCAPDRRVSITRVYRTF